MSNGERLRILRQAMELDRCSDAQLRELLPYVDEVAVPAGTRLAQQGRLGHQFGVVAAGELETCRDGIRGTLGPGGAFGWTAMIERGRNELTVTSVSSVRLLVMSHAQFRAVEAVLSEQAPSSEPALSRRLAS